MKRIESDTRGYRAYEGYCIVKICFTCVHTHTRVNQVMAIVCILDHNYDLQSKNIKTLNWSSLLILQSMGEEVRLGHWLPPLFFPLNFSLSQSIIYIDISFQTRTSSLFLPMPRARATSAQWWARECVSGKKYMFDIRCTDITGVSHNLEMMKYTMFFVTDSIQPVNSHGALSLIFAELFYLQPTCK